MCKVLCSKIHIAHKIQYVTILTTVFACFSLQAKPETKTGFKFFDHIYTINLRQSADRRQHVIQEFKRMGVDNFEIFTATDKDSAEVKNLMRSKVVKKYPPCYSCGKYICLCKSNYLIAPQIGNWLSFIRVFKDMIDKNYQYALITEDDVKFSDLTEKVFNTLINLESFAANGIDINKPILIRFEKRNNIQDQHKPPTFKTEKSMSNACFMVNKLFAESFIKHLTIIDRTSDMFIHYQILKLDPSIQHFSTSPMPAYQMSDNPQAIFYSEIQPRGIDQADLQRKKNHKFRIEYWEYLLGKLVFWRHA